MAARHQMTANGFIMKDISKFAQAGFMQAASFLTR
jgi:hypothetical protein